MGFSRFALDCLIARNRPLQVHLKGTPQPFGPGKIEPAYSAHELAHVADGGTHREELRQYYMISVEAMLQSGPNGRPGKVSLPVVFHIDDVLIVIGDPVNIEGSPIVMPTPGRGAGGLHIGGGS